MKINLIVVVDIPDGENPAHEVEYVAEHFEKRAFRLVPVDLTVDSWEVYVPSPEETADEYNDLAEAALRVEARNEYLTRVHDDTIAALQSAVNALKATAGPTESPFE